MRTGRGPGRGNATTTGGHCWGTRAGAIPSLVTCSTSGLRLHHAPVAGASRVLQKQEPLRPPFMPSGAAGRRGRRATNVDRLNRLGRAAEGQARRAAKAWSGRHGAPKRQAPPGRPRTAQLPGRACCPGQELTGSGSPARAVLTSTLHPALRQQAPAASPVRGKGILQPQSPAGSLGERCRRQAIFGLREVGCCSSAVPNSKLWPRSSTGKGGAVCRCSGPA